VIAHTGRGFSLAIVSPLEHKANVDSDIYVHNGQQGDDVLLLELFCPIICLKIVLIFSHKLQHEEQYSRRILFYLEL
jgi:hypothetical protein